MSGQLTDVDVIYSNYGAFAAIESVSCKEVSTTNNGLQLHWARIYIYIYVWGLRPLWYPSSEGLGLGFRV